MPPLNILYRNHRGDVAIRRIEPIRVSFGTSPYHPGEHWLLEAFCGQSHAERTFKMADIMAIYEECPQCQDTRQIHSDTVGDSFPCPRCRAPESLAHVREMGLMESEEPMKAPVSVGPLHPSWCGYSVRARQGVRPTHMDCHCDQRLAQKAYDEKGAL